MMMEAQPVITLEEEEENSNSNPDQEFGTSPNSGKVKRTRLTFPFGAW